MGSSVSARKVVGIGIPAKERVGIRALNRDRNELLEASVSERTSVVVPRRTRICKSPQHVPAAPPVPARRLERERSEEHARVPALVLVLLELLHLSCFERRSERTSLLSLAPHRISRAQRVHDRHVDAQRLAILEVLDENVSWFEAVVLCVPSQQVLDFLAAGETTLNCVFMNNVAN